MFKTTWISSLAVGALAAGGFAYYWHQHNTTVQTIAPTPSQVIVVPVERSDDEMNKRRAQGIGSIRNLKPVAIEPTSDRAQKK